MPGIIYVLWINQKISDKEFLITACISVIVNFLTYDAIDVFIQVIVLLLIHYFPYYSNKYLNFFGEISYSLYLTHVFTGVTVANILVKYTTYWYEKFFLVVFSTVICVVSAYFYYLWVEKPALRYSKKLKL
ncbi:MAG: hypothetical protein N2203_03590 [Bacteroidia bacterium]|nr:hypothetical protein [Bacteroidia bacterium]